MLSRLIHPVLSTALCVILPVGIVYGGGLDVRVEGVVLDDESGLPLEHAEVRLGEGRFVTHTDHRGEFAFEHIPAGRWKLLITRFGYRDAEPQWIMVADDVANQIRVYLTPRPFVLPEQQVYGSLGEIEDRPGTVQLTNEQLTANGFTNLVDALASLPGVIVNAGYTAGGNQQIIIRGESGKRLAIELDGVPLADGVRGEADLSAVPLSAVESITLHRGSSWRSGALGGLVQIKSRSVFPTERGVSLQFGSFASWLAAPHFSGSITSDIGYVLSAEFAGRNDAYKYVRQTGSDTARPNTEYGRENLYGKVGGRIPGIGSWGVSGLHYQNERGSPGPLHESSPRAILNDQRQLLTAALEGSPASRLDASAQIAISSYRTRYRNPDPIKAQSQFDEVLYKSSGEVVYQPSQSSRWTLRAGGELLHREVTGRNFLAPSRSFGDADRTANAFWLSGTVRSPRSLPAGWGRGHLHVGVRYDRDAHSPDFWAPQFSTAWSWGESWRVTLSGDWGRAFRRPLLTSLFWKEDIFSQGNPDLAPETAREWSAGVEVHIPIPDLSLGTTFFDRTYDGFIEWERRLGGRWAPVNLEQASLIGREDAITWDSWGNHVSLEFFHTLMWSTNQSPDRNERGKFLLFRPKHTYQVRANLEFREFQLRAGGRWVDRRYIRKQNTKWLPPYRWFDIGVEQQVLVKPVECTITVSGKNLTNEPVELLERYPLPGRSWYLALHVHF